MDQDQKDELMQKLEKDKRSLNQIFMTMADMMVTDYGIPREHSIEATQNLINFYTILLEVAEQNDLHKTENQPDE